MCKDISRMMLAAGELGQRRALEYASNPRVGVRMSEADWEDCDGAVELAAVDPNATFYYYDGPLDDRTRPFCAELLALGKLFSQDDMDYLSLRLGYDAFLYCGSFGCRHAWKRARIKGRIQEGFVPERPTPSDINDLDQLQEESGLTS